MLSCLKYLVGCILKRLLTPSLLFTFFYIDTGAVQLGSMVPWLQLGLLPSPRPAVLCLACKRQVVSSEYVQRPWNVILGPCKRHLLCSISLCFCSAFSLFLFWIPLPVKCPSLTSIPLNLTGIIEDCLPKLLNDWTNQTFSEVITLSEKVIVWDWLKAVSVSENFVRWVPLTNDFKLMLDH